MIELLESNSLLALFLVVALGYWIGRIPIRGSRIGVAAVLFVGLAVGALDPNLTIPSILLELGLVLFVYTIGLANGPGFFSKFRRDGLGQVLFIILIMLLPALLLLPAHFLIGFSPQTTAGMFAGISNNTPALAAVLDLINAAGSEAQAADAVVGFSLTYPLGILARIAVLAAVLRRRPVDFAAEAHRLRKQYPVTQDLQYRTLEVTNEESSGRPLSALLKEQKWDMLFGRLYRGDSISLVDSRTRFQLGDRLVVAGPQEELDAAQAFLGRAAEQDLLHEHAVYVSRRIFVSNEAIAGRKLSELNLLRDCQAQVSHVRRGDMRLLARGDTVLEWGDRIRVLAPHDKIPRLVQLFGDSYARLSQVNLLTTGLGIAIGLLIGLLAIPLPGGVTLRLGLAGGPLLVALILGALRRTGPVLWTMPYSANLTLRQLGLILLLATIGIRSGSAFLQALTGGAGWLILAIGLILIVISTTAALLFGRRLWRIPFSLLMGMVAPQPAVLDYAEEKAGNPLPGIGFTLMFPLAIIVNVIVAQVLLILLSRL